MRQLNNKSDIVETKNYFKTCDMADITPDIACMCYDEDANIHFLFLAITSLAYLSFNDSRALFTLPFALLSLVLFCKFQIKCFDYIFLGFIMLGTEPSLDYIVLSVAYYIVAKLIINRYYCNCQLDKLDAKVLGVVNLGFYLHTFEHSYNLQSRKQYTCIYIEYNGYKLKVDNIYNVKSMLEQAEDKAILVRQKSIFGYPLYKLVLLWEV